MLESEHPGRVRYMVVVSTYGRQDKEEAVILGMDIIEEDTAKIGLVLPVYADMQVEMDGEG